MVYRLKWEPATQRNYARLPDRLKREVIDELKTMRLDSPPAYAEALERELEGLSKIKINGHRIIFCVRDDLITILDIRRRNRNTYLNVP